MQFLTVRELSKTPKAVFSRLAGDGKAVITDNGKPTALMINVNDENFEEVFELVKEVERKMATARLYVRAVNDRERNDAFERLMNFPRAELPTDFDYKKELAEARNERFNRVD